MKQISTKLNLYGKTYLMAALVVFFMMFSKTSNAHTVLYYNPPCFTQGATVTVGVAINYAARYN